MKLNENQKVTITLGQLKKLVKESIGETREPSFKEWVEKELKQQEDDYDYTPKGMGRIYVDDYPMDDEKYVEELANDVHARPEDIEAAVMLSCLRNTDLDWIGDLVSGFANRFEGDVRYTVDLSTEAIYVAKISQSNMTK